MAINLRMLGKFNDLHTEANSAEDALRIRVAMPMNRDQYNESLRLEAARRVVMKNCMAKCDLTQEQLPNFNKNFYYNMPEAKHCITACWNTRMRAHGLIDEQNPGNRDNFFDFDAMKSEYQNYENWAPRAKLMRPLVEQYEDEKVDRLMSKLKDKNDTKKTYRLDMN